MSSISTKFRETYDFWVRNLAEFYFTLIFHNESKIRTIVPKYSLKFKNIVSRQAVASCHVLKSRARSKSVESHSHSLVSCDSHSRISLNALGESVLPALNVTIFRASQLHWVGEIDKCIHCVSCGKLNYQQFSFEMFFDLIGTFCTI